MFQAKDFYELTGLKRSTVRYYKREGLLVPSRVEENGYTYYDDRALVDAMLIRNYRCVDFSMKDIMTQEKFPLDKQISHLQALKQSYQDTVTELERKIQIVEAYSRAMEQYQELGQVTNGTSGFQMCSFYIKDVLSRHPQKAKEEIAFCINAFPFVHITGRGELREMSDHGEIHFEPGYEYNGTRGLFQPLHPELYHCTNTAAAVIVRLRVKDPLCLTAQDLEPLTKELTARGLPLEGPIFDLISGMEIKDGEKFYYVSVRIPEE